ncbi:restriction of telomere capping protein 5 [Ascobolus immersus RN42]|uniref:Restriction of telomere capping protein 5 n=1 Tax=Ascobolus immersus RN42 TaxID=1160509 RepID=A0A3N4IV96_ASCIM|nr:restriction of telomere capping protein 5 [Ascobolus immersus RN42]
MGQGHSNEEAASSSTFSIDQAPHLLAKRFASKCFQPVELYSLRDNFKSLADTSNDGKQYWKEDTFIKFLSIPDALGDGVGSLLYNSVTFLGSLPLTDAGPAICDADTLVKAVAIYTGRYTRALTGASSTAAIKLIFRSFAVLDKVEGVSAGDGTPMEPKEDPFVIGDSEDEEDEITIASLEALDAGKDDISKDKKRKTQFYIPREDFKKIVLLALFTAAIEPQQSLSVFVDRLTPEGLQSLQETAECVVKAVRMKEGKGVIYKDFKAAINTSLPYFLESFAPLFEHLLFAKSTDFSSLPTASSDTAATTAEKQPSILASLLSTDTDPNILTIDLLSQISFFLPPTTLFHNVRPLYTASQHGFSLGSFETKVHKWSAPTILLIKGTRLTTATPSYAQPFLKRLPLAPLPFGSTSTDEDENTTLIFGAYIEAPWKNTLRSCFGTSSTKLFQLSPVHEVWQGNPNSEDFVYFNRQSDLTIGCAVPKSSNSHLTQYTAPLLPVAPISLSIDSGLEFGYLHHAGHHSNAAFRQNRDSPREAGAEWQERFEIQEIEVWGCGGDKEAEEQRKKWAWEEREAELRKRINIGKGDIEADRALLEMAGIIGGGRSGGSIG